MFCHLWDLFTRAATTLVSLFGSSTVLMYNAEAERKNVHFAIDWPIKRTVKTQQKHQKSADECFYTRFSQLAADNRGQRPLMFDTLLRPKSIRGHPRTTKWLRNMPCHGQPRTSRSVVPGPADNRGQTADKAFTLKSHFRMIYPFKKFWRAANCFSS